MELFYFDQIEFTGGGGGCGCGGSQCAHPGGAEGKPAFSAPGGAQTQTETCFVQRHEDGADDVDLIGTCPETRRLSETTSSEFYFDDEDAPQDPELYLLSEDDLNSDAKSVDYGFIIAVTCLLTGISLVAISYTVPRDVRVDPDSVSAREMERLEREKARVGAHLDRCVIAGLCLLTLGGVLLSTLLMISMYKGEMMRRRAFAYSKHAAKLYGSISFKAEPCASPTRDSRFAEEDLEVLS
ncbi:transmembrane protein 74 [Eucyclogobius newberryi]|uniref:transmembrane protein 74 n=1 Tax=Eucyclogobius newberryi TaxID=166745 RepID=UPI003B5CD9F6